MFWVSDVELALCHPSRAQKLGVAPRFLEDCGLLHYCAIQNEIFWIHFFYHFSFLQWGEISHSCKMA